MDLAAGEVFKDVILPAKFLEEEIPPAGLGGFVLGLLLEDVEELFGLLVGQRFE